MHLFKIDHWCGLKFTGTPIIIDEDSEQITP